MQPALTRHSHMRLTSGQNLRLVRQVVQPSKHFAIARRERVTQVLDLRVGAEALHQRLQAT